MEYVPLIYLALFDFVPNIAFLVGAYFLVRIAAIVRGKTCSGLAAVGATFILVGGVLKAVWKLLITTNGIDLRLISDLQFVLLAPGFVALLAAIILLFRDSAHKSVTPMMVMAAWKMPFLVVMVVASLIAQGLLAYMAMRRCVYWASLAFMLAFLCLLAMGGMAGAEQTISQQWREEIINAFGQSAFALGSFWLYRDFKLHGC